MKIGRTPSTPSISPACSTITSICFDASEREKTSIAFSLLAAAREPTEADADSWHLAGFQFKGCDLIEEWSEVSALTNCGGFEAAFRSADLSPCGLIPRAARAYEIRDALNIHYPDEEHADCAAWAVWRLEHRLTHR